jgi:serine/threonine protein kinase
MPDDRTGQFDDSSEFNPDPLGIIGWVIGGKYKVQAYLGGGGFGEVYEGYNENLTEQRLVIKFFKRVQAREKFAKEAKILCLLDHPNICRVIDYLPDEGAVVVAYIDGKDGSVILKESGALAEEQFLNVARSMTAAIAYAHEKKIAHRDIKPGNILLDNRGHVFLIDFGIAKEMGTAATKTAYNALTPMFAAPERQSGVKDYNPFVSDIYETGITLFNLATNSLPYRNPANPNVDEWGGSVARKLSAELTRILKKATHPIPKKRHQSAAELAKDLQKLDKAFGGGRKFPVRPIAITIILALIAIFAWQFGEGIWRQIFPEQTAIDQQMETSTADDDNTSIITDTAGQVDQIAAGEDTTLRPPDQQSASTGMVADDKKPEESVTVADAAIQATQDKTVEEEQKPKPPPISELLVQVFPENNITLTVDGVKRTPNQYFELKPGDYDISITHPDYPIYRHSVNLTNEPVDLNLNLNQEFAVLDTVDMQVALIPWSDKHILEFWRNGRKQTITSFPLLGMRQTAGEWNVNLNLIPIGEAAGQDVQIDSCVVFPHGGGPHHAVYGHEGILTIEPSAEDKAATVPLLIYWSEK